MGHRMSTPIAHDTSLQQLNRGQMALLPLPHKVSTCVAPTLLPPPAVLLRYYMPRCAAPAQGFAA